MPVAKTEVSNWGLWMEGIKWTGDALDALKKLLNGIELGETPPLGC